jgi:hypothetical protein
MKSSSLIPAVAASFAAFILPTVALAQRLPGNTNLSRSTALKSFIAAGSQNVIQSNSRTCFIGGGSFNNIETNVFNGVIAGGGDNSIRPSAHDSVIGGGVYNNVSASAAVIGGGGTNSASGDNAAVAGGGLNSAAATFSAIGGGSFNRVTETATNAVIGGGNRNTNSGSFAVIPGGQFNKVRGTGSFAAGTTADAFHDRSFVWGDGTAVTSSSNTNTFTVRASGGAKFLSSSGASLGPSLSPNGPDWDSNSDSNLKTEVTAIDHRSVLAKLSAMPVSSWQFKHDRVRRYIGPMAQDFHTFFGLGSSDKTIGTLDANGVLFSSVKGLVEELKERDKAMAARDRIIEELRAKNSELSRSIEAINQRLDSLPPAP